MVTRRALNKSNATRLWNKLKIVWAIFIQNFMRVAPLIVA